MALFARANANTALLTNNCYLLKFTNHDVIFRGFGSYATKFATARRSTMCACLVQSFSRLNVTSISQKNFLRKCHVTPHNANYVPYSELIARRRQEATKSIIVQVQSANSYPELFSYCEQFGTVKEMHHYSVKDSLHFYLIEFNELASAKTALESATHVNLDEAIPVQSPMLWFRNARQPTSAATNNNASYGNSISGPSTINGCNMPSEALLAERIASAGSISEQMILFYDAWKLDEVDIRLRFLTAYQLEQSFIGLFPRIAVLPFGSSVNGFGKRGCDLDLVLNLENDKIEKSYSRFVFHTKSISSDNKAQAKRLMETIADSMQYFVPGVKNVRRILQARVPIIKYDQTFTGLECDLSMTNMAAVYMSELLCFYGEVDWRVRPLVFTIRHWAKSVGLTNATPGRWITNFSITLLVIFYLQQREILPAIKTLKDLADKSDVRITDHLVDCTFLRDVTKMPQPAKSVNTDSLETLLQGFFEFYSSFDFPAKAISLREGSSIFKTDFSPLYICNPLEPTLNVSKNVSTEETERLRLAVRNASWVLETANDDSRRRRGILTIFEQKLDIISYVAGKRVVNLSSIFKLPNDESEKHSQLGKPAAKEVSKDSDESAESKANRNFGIKKGRLRRR